MTNKDSIDLIIIILSNIVNEYIKSFILIFLSTFNDILSFKCFKIGACPIPSLTLFTYSTLIFYLCSNYNFCKFY